jgi:hypothetical protein
MPSTPLDPSGSPIASVVFSSPQFALFQQELSILLNKTGDSHFATTKAGWNRPNEGG